MARFRRTLGGQHPATLNALQSTRADCDVDPMPHGRWRLSPPAEALMEPVGDRGGDRQPGPLPHRLVDRPNKLGPVDENPPARVGSVRRGRDDQAGPGRQVGRVGGNHRAVARLRVSSASANLGPRRSTSRPPDMAGTTPHWPRVGQTSPGRAASCGRARGVLGASDRGWA